ncbi:MAG TPA: DMT family transporter [Xanthomonadales bacterium]|nr:DMT family transporter [Xanthomonadales bacterium]
MGKGELFSLASALAWAFGVILYARLGKRIDPLALNLRKNVVVLLMMVPLLAVRATAPALPALDAAIAVVSGAVGIAIADTLYFRALNEIGAGRMGVIGNLFSPFVIALSYLFLGERLTSMQLAGFLLVSTGVVVVQPPQATPGTRRFGRGVAYGALAVLLMAAAIVLVKRVLERNDLFWVSTLRLAGGVATMGALVWWQRRRGGTTEAALDRRGWLLLVAAAFVGQMLSMLLWLAGYKFTSASVAAILNETASAFIVLLAWLLLREPLTRRRIVGVTLTLGGVVLMLQ